MPDALDAFLDARPQTGDAIDAFLGAAPTPAREPYIGTMDIEGGTAPIPTLGQRVRGSGVSTAGAPGDIRELEGFALNDEQVRLATQKALERRLGAPVEMRQGSVSGRLEYRPKGADQFTTVDPPGIDFGDFRSMLGQALPLGGAVAGGIGGGAAGALGGPAVGTAGALTGETVGTFVGELARLTEGQRRGAVPADMDVYDLMLEAAKTAGLSLAGAVGARAAFSLARNVLRGRMPVDLDEAEFLRRLSDDEARSTVGTQPTTGQMMRGTEAGDELLSAERAIAGETGPMGQQFRQRERANVEAGRRYFDQVSPSAEVSEEQVGRQIRGQAHQALSSQAAQQETAVGRANDKALGAVLDVTRGTPGTEAGPTVRGGLSRAVDQFESEAERRFDAIREKVQGLTVKPANLTTEAEGYRNLLNTDLFKSLTPEDRALVKDALDLKAMSPSSLVDASGKPLPPREVTQDISYEQISRALSALRRLERRVVKGETSTADAAMISRFKGALLRDRAAMLKGSPDLAKEVADAEVWYRGQKDLLDRSFIGRVLAKTDGVYRIADEDVFETFFKRDNISAAKSLETILKQPGYEGELQAMRDAIKNEWRRRVLGPDGLPVPKNHARFMRDYGDTMRRFLPKAEAARMNNAAVFRVDLEREQQALEKLRTELADTFEGRVADIRDPVAVIDATWRAKRPEPSRKLHALIQSDKGLSDAYRAAIVGRMRADISTPTDAGDMIDPAKLKAYLADFGPQLRTWFGGEYVRNLGLLQKAMEEVTAKPLTATRMQTPGASKAMYDLARAYVGLFTRPGRFLTAYRRMSEGQGEQKLGEFLLNPETARNYLPLNNLSGGSKRALEILGAMGAYELAVDPDVESGAN